MSSPFGIVSTAEMSALEAAAMRAGTPEYELQERAGRAVADVVVSDPRAGPRVIVLAGPGNNGRDGVVAARYLASWGRSVQIWSGPKPPWTAPELAALSSAGIGVQTFDSAEKDVALADALAESDVAIDALLGIGVHGPIRGELATMADRLVQARTVRRSLLVVAVDVPSGLDADDGSVPGPAIRADVTVTFGAVKSGLLRFPGAHLVGRLEPREIGLPGAEVDRLATRVLDDRAVGPLVPPRPIDGHKYSFGRVLVVAGSDAYLGAACLCTAAAARSGCGWVAVASTQAVKTVLATTLPEATYPTAPLDVEREPDQTADRLAELLPGYRTLLIGPGLGRSPATERFVRRLLQANATSGHAVPAVIDADALSLLAGWDGWWERIGAGHVLTPHAGEMARLVGADAADPSDQPWDSARRFARLWRQVVVLKGPFTAIASNVGQAWVYPHANPALATAGTGDVLAGLCAGLVAQGTPTFDAARLAVVTHARAGRLVVERGWRSLVASDLLTEIPRALASLERAS